MISAVILTKNEEKNIEECLSCLSFCNEIIVLDDNSTDNTVSLAKKHGAKVMSRVLSEDFSTQRNFALSQAKNEWVLFIDADERIDARLKEDILKAIKQGNKEGFYIKRRDFLWGKPLLHGESGQIKLLRLGKKIAGKWVGTIHETWKMQGATGELTHYLLHYPHQTVTEFLTEINFYTTLRARELFKQHVTSGWLDIIFYTKAKFFQNYILKLGFLDGVRGLIVAVIMSMHSFLVRGKLWQLQENK